MIDKIAKSNQPTQVLLLLFMIILLWIPGFFINGIEADTIDYQHSFTVLFSKLWTFQFLPVIFGMILLAVVALLFSRMLYAQRVHTSASFVPSFLLVLFFSVSPENLTFSPLLLTSALLIFTLSLAFHLAEKEDSFTELWYGSVFIGLTIYFFYQAIFLIPWLWICFLIFKKISWHEWAISILGIITPFGLLWAVSLLKSNNKSFFESVNSITEFSIGNPIEITPFSIILICCFILIIIPSLRYSLGRPPENLRQGKQFILSYFWLSIFIVIASILYSDTKIFTLLSIPFAFFVSASVEGNKRRRFSKLIIWIIFFVILIHNYYSIFTQ